MFRSEVPLSAILNSGGALWRSFDCAELRLQDALSALGLAIAVCWA